MRKLTPWLSAVAILVIVFGTIYAAIQQSQRNNADYPQIQIAEDAASSLNQNVRPETLTVGKVNINTSLAPFIIIYNKSGQVVSGSGYLNGTIPTAPFGILTDANGQVYHRVTWQPQSGVRIAAVTVSSSKYYVLSGRSLKEVEVNIDQALQVTFAGGVVSLGVLVVAFMICKPIIKK